MWFVRSHTPIRPCRRRQLVHPSNTHVPPSLPSPAIMICVARSLTGMPVQIKQTFECALTFVFPFFPGICLAWKSYLLDYYGKGGSGFSFPKQFFWCQWVETDPTRGALQSRVKYLPPLRSWKFSKFPLHSKEAGLLWERWVRIFFSQATFLVPLCRDWPN